MLTNVPKIGILFINRHKTATIYDWLEQIFIISYLKYPHHVK